jgi:hypothetical protein
MEELHLAGKADAIIHGGGLVQEIELDLPDPLYLLEHVILNAPILDYMNILEDGFNDSLIFSEALLGQGDVHVQVREGPVKLVIVRGRKLEGQALCYKIGQKGIFSLMPEEVRVIPQRLRLILSLGRWQVPNQAHDILIFDGDKSDDLTKVARIVSGRLA